MNQSKQSKQSQIKTITLSGRTFKDENSEYWISECFELPLAGYGKTAEEAFKSFRSCLDSYREAAIKLKSWDALLKKHGLIWTTSKSEMEWSMQEARGNELVPA